MYVILVYDIDESRVTKVNHLLKAYLLWVQNSVFEGDISESVYDRMCKRLGKIIKGSDSVLIYKFRTKIYVEKQTFGMEKGQTDNVI